MRDGRFQQAHQPRRHRLRRGALEEVEAVFQGAGEAPRRPVGVAGFLEVEGEVEAGEVGGQLLHAAVEPGQGGLDPAVVLQDEHDLEQRVASEGAGGLYGLDQVMEGEILVLVGGEVEVADPRDELAEGGMAGEIGAEDQGVDEEADEVLEGLVQSAGGGGSDGDVVAGAESAEEGGQSRLEDHEQGGAAVVGQGQQAAVQAGVQVDGDGAAAVAGGPGTSVIHGQAEFFGHPGEPPPPERELLGQEAAGIVGFAEQLALPAGVIGILDRQGREVGAPCRAIGRHRPGRGPASTGRGSRRRWRYGGSRAGAHGSADPAGTARRATGGCGTGRRRWRRPP